MLLFSRTVERLLACCTFLIVVAAPSILFQAVASSSKSNDDWIKVSSWSGFWFCSSWYLVFHPLLKSLYDLASDAPLLRERVEWLISSKPLTRSLRIGVVVFGAWLTSVLQTFVFTPSIVTLLFSLVTWITALIGLSVLFPRPTRIFETEEPPDDIQGQVQWLIRYQTEHPLSSTVSSSPRRSPTTSHSPSLEEQLLQDPLVVAVLPPRLPTEPAGTVDTKPRKPLKPVFKQTQNGQHVRFDLAATLEASDLIFRVIQNPNNGRHAYAVRGFFMYRRQLESKHSAVAEAMIRQHPVTHANRWSFLRDPASRHRFVATLALATCIVLFLDDWLPFGLWTSALTVLVLSASWFFLFLSDYWYRTDVEYLNPHYVWSFVLLSTSLPLAMANVLLRFYFKRPDLHALSYATLALMQGYNAFFRQLMLRITGREEFYAYMQFPSQVVNYAFQYAWFRLADSNHLTWTWVLAQVWSAVQNILSVTETYSDVVAFLKNRVLTPLAHKCLIFLGFHPESGPSDEPTDEPLDAECDELKADVDNLFSHTYQMQLFSQEFMADVACFLTLPLFAYLNPVDGQTPGQEQKMGARLQVMLIIKIVTWFISFLIFCRRMHPLTRRLTQQLQTLDESTLHDRIRAIYQKRVPVEALGIVEIQFRESTLHQKARADLSRSLYGLDDFVFLLFDFASLSQHWMYFVAVEVFFVLQSLHTCPGHASESRFVFSHHC